MQDKQTIAVYIPRWLYQDDVGITLFVRGLYHSIEESDTYTLLLLTPAMCNFASVQEAKAFVDTHTVAMVVYHDTRSLAITTTLDQGLAYLEACVPFLNSASVHIADDKLQTKQILENSNIPTIPHSVVRTTSELFTAMHTNELYVIKPHDRASGKGVKLIKRNETDLFEYLDGSWQKIKAFSTKRGLVVMGRLGFQLSISIVLFGLASCALFFRMFEPFIDPIWSLCGIAFIFLAQKKMQQNYIYNPMMIEPFFADTMDEFYCLRCTVLGDEVIETVKKSNKKNVTPNISHGGIATVIEFTPQQKQMAIAASRAVGATFSGIDLLCARGKTVVCEVNVGPIGLYCEQSGVDVGGMLGNHVMKKCDEFAMLQ